MSVARAVLLPLGGLIVWAVHFAAIYAAHALSCERELARATLLGLPAVSVFVIAVTVVALGAIAALVIHLGCIGLPVTEGGGAEPRFTLWFGAATAALSAIAIVFETVPALVLTACG